MTTYPLFVFSRFPHIELEGNYKLAGHLIIDAPNPDEGERMPKSVQRGVKKIIEKLGEMRDAGKLPLDSRLIIGWPGGEKPADAVDLGDDQLMSEWADQSIKINVRACDDTDPSRIPVDSQMLASVLEVDPDDEEAIGEVREHLERKGLIERYVGPDGKQYWRTVKGTLPRGERCDGLDA